MKMGQIIQLENVLRTWEDGCLAMEGGYKHGLAEGGLMAEKQYFEYGSELREYLIHSFGQPFDRRFIADEPPDTSFKRIWNMLPIFLHAWVNSSKRIYHLSALLANMFLATSLKKVDCEDIHFPFSAFVLTLEQPIADAHNHYDCLLFANDVDFYGEKCLAILLLDTKWKSAKLMDQDVKDKIRWAIRKKRWDKVDKKFKQFDLLQAENRPRVQSYYIYKQFWHGGITQFVKQYQSMLKDQEYDERLALKVFQLLMGICFFFQNMPNDVREKRAKSITPSALKPKAPVPVKLFEASQIFTFSTERIISQEEKQVFTDISTESLARWQVSPHFRSGYWRRPSGYGQDPSCPKTIWVKPCLVNADLVQGNVLPLGSKNILK
ncbi:MAG: hypothetical protein A2Y67_02470 [Candidatus Buchananbacteria bacterium RBG_13_39_9]|uniref:Uncharacterized protein n=1 Tax=Candidatus Buchananbacteria bacterium RBG_13_39_9 TaxID=1797531 RepID=A0A1G1XT18_9BACT|nr:MAG: hypothetical protein A2Y67_02470 [Candidatus Buchananbacteria bacterium RBG_13_39_9]